MNFNVFLKMQFSDQPPQRILTLHEKNENGTAIQLLNAVNSMLPRLNVAITKTTFDQFGDAVQESLIIKGTKVDIWYYLDDQDFFIGNMTFDNNSQALIMIKGNEE